MNSSRNDPRQNGRAADEARPATPKRRAFLLAGAAAVAAGTFAVYGIARSVDKHAPHTGACAQSLDLAAAADPLVHGEVAALTLASKANPLGPLAFDGPDGTRVTVSALAGKTLLLNLWATWCIPCRAEMPALDRLQASLGSSRFQVVPVNVDTARLEKARDFFGEIGAKSLPYYADHSADILQSLKTVGLPTTVLIGRDGCEIGTMAGPAQWDSPEAKALIQRLEAPAQAAPSAS
jgi:thiol-disulfide isomerase/thioredoxin